MGLILCCPNIRVPLLNTNPRYLTYIRQNWDLDLETWYPFSARKLNNALVLLCEISSVGVQRKRSYTYCMAFVGD